MVIRVERNPSTNEPAVPRLALRPRDAAVALGIGERTLWQMTKDGDVPHVRIGKLVVYPVYLLQRWLEEKAAAAEAKKDEDNGKSHI